MNLDPYFKSCVWIRIKKGYRYAKSGSPLFPFITSFFSQENFMLTGLFSFDNVKMQTFWKRYKLEKFGDNMQKVITIIFGTFANHSNYEYIKLQILKIKRIIYYDH